MGLWAGRNLGTSLGETSMPNTFLFYAEYILHIVYFNKHI